MKFVSGIFLAIVSLACAASGADVAADFTAVSTVPVTAASYTATGNSVTISLGFEPPTGTDLMVVKNTGPDFISGQFSNLAYGQQIGLIYNGANYQFVANYYGGSGNDLVLQWVGRSLYSSGSNDYGQLGNNSAGYSSVPVTVFKKGALSGKSVVAMETGLFHNLALCSDGTMAAWGISSSGQLGNSSVVYSSSVPVLVDTKGVLAGKTVSAVSAGYRYCLALCSDGTVASWGDNSDGQLGANGTSNSSVPLAVTGGALVGKTVVAVSAGFTHSLALCSDGSVAAWGSNDFGQLGDGGIASSSVPVTVTDSSVLSGKTVIAVAAGESFSLALCSDGTVASWGYNFSGQLGNNSSSYYSADPVAVDRTGILAGKIVVEISAGASHSLARCSDGTMVSWGYNNYGQLGNNSKFKSKVPVAVNMSGVLAGKTVTRLSAGDWYSLVLCSDGSAAAWGYNHDGQLGNNGTTDLSVPAAVVSSGALSGKTVVALSAGSSHSLAVCSDGSAVAWGSNSGASDLLGNDGIITSSRVPVEVEKAGFLAEKTVIQFSAGYKHGLALCSDGSVAAWGWNSNGQLGDNSTDSRSVPVPVTLTGVLAGKTVVAVSAGGYHSLALCSDGTVFAWGYNYAGQLGNNSTIDSSTPVEVTRSGVLHGKTVVAISAGTYFSLALCSDGTVATWGENDDGQLGNGTIASSSAPVAVTSSGVLAGKAVISVAAKYDFCLALCSDGSVVAWGSNDSGQLGNGGSTVSLAPVAVSGSGVLAGKTVVAVAAGFRHSLALCSDGTMAAWGDNGSGQLGNNSTTDSSVPVAVNNSGILAGKTVVGISAASYRCLAWCTDGTMTIWGSDFGIKKVPVAIDGSGVLAGKTVVAMDAGSGHNLLIAADPLSADSTLGSLTLESSTLSPEFSPGTNAYSVSVLNSKESVTITPVVSNAYASVTVNGESVPSGSASPPIPLSVGQNTITVLVTAQNGTATSAYTVTVTRLSNVATLSGLTPSSGSLSPNFASATSDYMIGVSNDTTSIAVTPTVTDSTATVSVNGEAVTSGSESQAIPLNVGLNTINVLVTAEDGTTTSTYAVTVTRSPSSVSTLSGLVLGVGTLSPAFSPETTSYAVAVANSVATLKVTPTAGDGTATVKVNGATVASGVASSPISLMVGITTIKVLVMAQDGVASTTYTVIVTRAKSSDATLSALVVKTAALKSSFNPSKRAYTAAVSKSVKSVKIKTTAANSEAKIKINGIAVRSGALSRPLPLKPGKNLITIVLTAQDGTTGTYKITIVRGLATKSAKEYSATATRAVVSKMKVDGMTYLQISLERIPGMPRPVVEVSPDLVDWFSGSKHTTTLVDDGRILTVRDNTPARAGEKRFIRVRRD